MYDKQLDREVQSVPTPWGFADRKDEVAPGIVFYSTPSHGGFWLSDERMAEMPEYMAGETFGENGPHWYEEDCDWALVAVVFNAQYPEAFSGGQYHDAFHTLKNWKPEVFERFFGVKLEVSESYMLRERAKGTRWAQA